MFGLPGKSPVAYRGRFGPSVSKVRDGEVGLSVAGTEIDSSPRKAAYRARLALSSGGQS